MKLKIDFDFKNLINYVVTILATALVITTVLIALPLTEKVSEATSFDLITKDSNYWAKEYLLAIDSNDEKDIRKTRDVLHKRLQNFEVERAKVIVLGEDEELGSILRINVDTTKDENYVRELILNRFEVEIVSRKEDVDFWNEEDQFAYLFGENYNSTGWDRTDFRNVHITELRTADDSYAYFAIFKLWPNRQTEFENFLEQYKGDYIGVSTDGFVTPYLVPLEDQNIFAVPVNSEDEEQVRVLSILYNSGIIPVDYSLIGDTEIDSAVVSVNHIGISIGLAVSLLLTYFYLAILKQMDIEVLKKAFLATVLTISIYLTVLKFFQFPIDTFLLPILAILTFILIKVIVANKDSVVYIETGLILIFLLVRIFGMGYIEIMANHIIGLILLSKICVVFSGWYINKVRNI